MFVNRNNVYWAKVTQQLTLSRRYSQLVANRCCRFACSLLETPFVTRDFFVRKICSWTDLFVMRGVREPICSWWEAFVNRGSTVLTPQQQVSSFNFVTLSSYQSLMMTLRETCRCVPQKINPFRSYFETRPTLWFSCSRLFSSSLTLSNTIFLPPAYSPALIYFGWERGWWITCNFPTVLKEKNINRKSTTYAICWLKSLLHEEKRREQENHNVGLRPTLWFSYSRRFSSCTTDFSQQIAQLVLFLFFSFKAVG
jgi:hypothetical protein